MTEQFAAPRRGARTVGLVTGLLAVLIAGCGSSPAIWPPLTMAQMRQHLDLVPLPADVTRMLTYERPRRGATPGAISRYLRYRGSAHPMCRVLLGAASRAGYRIQDVRGEPVSPVTCSGPVPRPALSPAAGVVNLVGPGGVTVELGWGEPEAIQLVIQDAGRP